MCMMNAERPGCKDVFNAFLVSDAEYAGEFELPIIHHYEGKPTKLISFSKALAGGDCDRWVHFYEDDCRFERLWRNPRRYLDILKRYKGVILPDFSVYRDMPFAMQVWNIYRSRAIGAWLQANGLHVITNVRFGDERTYELCCDGVPKHSIVAVGTHGLMKQPLNRAYFAEGLAVVINRLQPRTLIVYGPAPDAIFGEYRTLGIAVLPFESECARAHKAGV